MGYTISKEIEFDAGHRVPLHTSKCHNPHGHRYRVVATVSGELIEVGPETGMVRDFSIIKHLLTERVHDLYDHAFIVHQEDTAIIELFFRMGWRTIVVPFYPTAECLAKEIYWDLKNHGLDGLIAISVWETPTSCADYQED